MIFKRQKTETKRMDPKKRRQLESTVSFANQVSRRYGVKVVMAEPNHEKLLLSDGTSAAAAYDRETDTIYVSKEAKQGDVIRAKIIHELTHRTEKTEAYKEFSDAVLNAYFKGDKKKMDAARNSIKNLYASKGVNLTPERLEAELVAKAAEKLIGGDQEMVNRLVADSPGVVRRVIDAIRNVLSKLTGVKDAEIDCRRVNYVSQGGSSGIGRD